MLTLKLARREPKRTRIFECISVLAEPRGSDTAVQIFLPGENMQEILLGEAHEYDIGFVTDSSGYTVQIIKSGNGSVRS